MTCPLHLPTPHEIAGALRCCDRATLQSTLCPRTTLDMHALSGHAARWGQFRAGFGSFAPALAWTTALIPALASVGAPWRLPRLLAALASLRLTVGGKRKASYYAFYAPEYGCGVFDSWQRCSKWCTNVACNFNRGCGTYDEACEAAAAALWPSPCSLVAGCAGSYAGAHPGAVRSCTSAVSGGGALAVALLARRGLRWLLRWRAPL